MKYWINLYLYSLFLGLRSIIINPLKINKETLKRLIIPMDIARYFEIPSTFQYLDIQKNDKVFDLSSPKLIAFYLVEIRRTTIVSSDVWVEEVESWKHFKEDGLSRKIFRNLKLKVIDGRRIAYPSGYFDKVYSISVIEHIEKDGDTKTIKELARILKPGGLLVLTTPLGKKYQELWVNRNAYAKKYTGEKAIFLSRIYSQKMLNERLIKPSGLTLDKQLVCEEQYPIITTIYTKLFPLSILLGLCFPLLSAITLRVGKKIGKKNNTLLVLRKI